MQLSLGKQGGLREQTLMLPPKISRETELPGNACIHEQNGDGAGSLHAVGTGRPDLEKQTSGQEVILQNSRAVRRQKLSPENHLGSVKSFSGLDKAAHILLLLNLEIIPSPPPTEQCLTNH